MAAAFTAMLNLAMRLERERHVGAQAYERSPQRSGYANGYKAKKIDTQAGTLTVEVPKSRGVRVVCSRSRKTKNNKERCPFFDTIELIVAWTSGSNTVEDCQAGQDDRQFGLLQCIFGDAPNVPSGDFALHNDKIIMVIKQEQQGKAPAGPVAKRHRGVSRPSGAQAHIEHRDIELAFVEAFVELVRILGCRHV